MPSLTQDEDGADSDTSLSWEEFFGSTTAEDLVPTLLTMYDALVGRGQASNGWRCDDSWSGDTVSQQEETWCATRAQLGASPATGSWGHDREPRPPQEPPPPLPPRPLSVSSITSSSSSSTSSVTSSSGSSGTRRLTKGSAYLASIESLEDTDDEVERHRPNRLQDSGLCSPCSYISSPCPPSSKPKYCDPNLSYMDRVVMEVIETEGVYVSHLKEVIIGYLERWETSPDCPLTPVQLSDLFGNLKEIYNFNSFFLTELEQCELDPVKIARVFVKNKPGFTVYTEYCTNYPRTVGVLTELMSEESKVRLFRERQSALLHTLPLGSYLLKPVQRILKYHLLLQNIVKHSKSECGGYADIVEALSGMTSIAHHINDMKRKHEHAVRVQEIQSLLLGWQGEDLTRFGELCAEGTFGMAGAKALRHLFLFDKILLITKKKEEGILGYKTHIMCSNLMLIESVPGEPLSFHVIPFDNPRLQYTLQARSHEQKREWMLQLKRVILENYNAVIPSHARQLVMQLGQHHNDDDLVAEKSTPKKQHSAPEYLERRKQERRKSEGGPGLRARLRTRARKTPDLVTVIKSEQRLLRRGSQQPAISNERLSSSTNQLEETGLARRQSEPAACFLAETEKSTEQISESNSTEQQISEAEFTEEEASQQSEKKKTLEEIVSQLLMQNKEFQRVLKKQRLAPRRCKVETSDEEDEGLGSRSRSLSGRIQKESDYDNLRDVWETGSDPLKRTQSFSASQRCSREIPEIVLSASSTSFEEPTSPAVWLKQQREHLAAPNHKAGSLPRGFQLGGSPDWHRTARVSPERPFTIASDKAQELNLEDMQHYVDSGTDLRLHRFPLPDDTTTEEDTTPDTSTHNLSIHPEYKIYRSSLTMSSLKHVLSSVSGKLASLRLSSETLDIVDSEHRSNRMLSFARTFRHKKSENDLPVYKQGSSGLGARIAHGIETTDYADPRTLFPNITQSKKAASLLGIRPYSVLSLASNVTSSSGYSGSTSSSNQTKDPESDENSADSFYERSFDALESNLDTEMCRDSAIFSDPEDITEQITKKIPPPVPEKPSNLSWRLSENKKTVTCVTPNLPSPDPYSNFSPDKVEDEYDSSSVASTVIEAAAPKGWVQHVIGKIQGQHS